MICLKNQLKIIVYGKKILKIILHKYDMILVI